MIQTKYLNFSNFSWLCVSVELVVSLGSLPEQNNNLFANILYIFLKKGVRTIKFSTKKERQPITWREKFLQFPLLL